MLRLKQKPVRTFFLVGSLILLICFAIALPIYRSANMTPEEHFRQGLADLTNNKFASAQTHLRKVAQKQQNAQAFLILAQMEMEGKNAQQKANPKQAAEYFEQAALLGIKEAQYQLALLYDRGEGVAQNPQNALKWSLLAAAQGHVEAMYAAAVWLERGYTGKSEPYQALTLYESAAEKGHKRAMTTLVSIYAGTENVPANKERGLYWKNKLQQTIKAPAPQQTKTQNKKTNTEKAKK